MMEARATTMSEIKRADRASSESDRLCGYSYRRMNIPALRSYLHDSLSRGSAAFNHRPACTRGLLCNCGSASESQGQSVWTATESECDRTGTQASRRDGSHANAHRIRSPHGLFVLRAAIASSPAVVTGVVDIVPASIIFAACVCVSLDEC
jgi:hypothetical protein